MSGDIWGHYLAERCYRHLTGEGRKAAKHPTMQRTATSKTKNYVAQSSEEVEKCALGFEPSAKQVSKS